MPDDPPSLEGFLRREYVDRRRSTTAIGEELGRSYEWVRLKLIEFDIPRRTTAPRTGLTERTIALLADRSWLSDAFAYSNIQEISEELGVYRKHVAKAIRDLDIDPTGQLARKHRRRATKWPGRASEPSLRSAWRRAVGRSGSGRSSEPSRTDAGISSLCASWRWCSSPSGRGWNVRIWRSGLAPTA